MSTVETKTLRERLTALIGETGEICRSLSAALAEEHRALKERDTDTITRVAADKAGLVDNLERIERERLELLSAAGCNHKGEDFSDCLDTLDPGGTLKRLWSSAMETLEQCRHQNLLNGAMIDASRRFVERALGIIRGEAATPDLYDTSGRTGSGHTTRHLAQA